MTPEEIAELSARTAAEVLRGNQPPAPEPEELPSEIAANVHIYKELEKINPKYKGVAKKIVEFQKAEVARADAWEAAHPGESYNAEAPEHAQWYAKNEIKIDPDDWDEAKFEVRYQKRMERDVQPKLKEAEQVVSQMKAAPAAEQAIGRFTADLLSAVDPEVRDFTPAALNTWAESNPIESDIVQQVHAATAPVVKAASLLWDGAAEFNEKNPQHIEARNWFNELESQLSIQPVNDEHGRVWVPVAKFAQMTPQQQAKHFTTTKSGLIKFISAVSAEQVKKVAKERKEFAEKYAQRLGYKKADAGSITPQPNQPVPAPHIPSPSISGGSATPPAHGVAPNGGGDGRTLLQKMLYGR